jgi:hypothetical protein
LAFASQAKELAMTHVPMLAVFFGPSGLYSVSFCRVRGSLIPSAPAKTRYSAIVPRRMLDAPSFGVFDDPIETISEKQGNSQNGSVDFSEGDEKKD